MGEKGEEEDGTRVREHKQHSTGFGARPVVVYQALPQSHFNERKHSTATVPMTARHCRRQQEAAHKGREGGKKKNRLFCVALKGST